MSTENSVYLDHNATTPPSPELRRVLPELVLASGNPSSIHWAGREPKLWLRETRRELADFLGCHPLELIFTSGASESNNAVLRSVWDERKSTRPQIIASSVEHPSVRRTLEWLQTLGAQVDWIPVNRRGELDLDFLDRKLSERTALVTVMAANNETGTLFPIAEIARRAHAVGAWMHTDAVQIFGKLPIDLEEMGVDFASFSAHKFYALKGTGVLFVKKGLPFSPLIWGGGQERHRRGGTENVLGIAALGVVLKSRDRVALESERMARLRDHFEARVLEEIPDCSITAAETPRLPNTSSLVLDGVDGETMLMSLDLKGYAVSTGAACSSGSPEPSPVLLAMGLSRQEAQNSLRVSFGWENTLEQVDAFVETLKQVVQRLRSIELRPQRSEGACHA